MLAGGFFLWHWKIRLLYYRDVAKEKTKLKIHEISEHVRELITRHRESVREEESRNSIHDEGSYPMMLYYNYIDNRPILPLELHLWK